MPRLKNGPSRPPVAPVLGKRREAYVEKLSEITIERCKEPASELAARFTNFKGNFTNPVEIPNVISPPDIAGAGRLGIGQPRRT